MSLQYWIHALERYWIRNTANVYWIKKCVCVGCPAGPEPAGGAGCQPGGPPEENHELHPGHPDSALRQRQRRIPRLDPPPLHPLISELRTKFQIWQFFYNYRSELWPVLSPYITSKPLIIFFSQIEYLFAILSFAHKLAQYLFFKTEIFHWSNSKALPLFLLNHRIPVVLPTLPSYSKTFPNTYHTVCVQMSYMYIRCVQYWLEQIRDVS